jgi:hypothetical protein
MDAYCERVGMGVLAEPLNAFSNVSFLLAAWAAWVLATRTGALSAGVRALILLGASVGVGSILWHMVPNMWTLILDSVPILVFIVWFVWLYARNVVGIRPPLAAAVAAAFVVATFLVFPLAGVLHGALVYTPGLIVTLALGLYQARERSVERFTLLAAAGVYLAALFFRTIDNEVCAALPIGTHFVWHLLIGLVTYLAMRTLILTTATRSRTRVR